MDYFLRATQSDWPELLSLGVTLGILRVSESGEHCGDGWDYIGPVYRETGQSVTVDGIETALTAPVLAPDGQPYIHANLRTTDNLRELAAAHGIPTDNLARFFVTDENGAPKRPDMPARVFF